MTTVQSFRKSSQSLKCASTSYISIHVNCICWLCLTRVRDRDCVRLHTCGVLANQGSQVWQAVTHTLIERMLAVTTCSEHIQVQTAINRFIQYVSSCPDIGETQQKPRYVVCVKADTYSARTENFVLSHRAARTEWRHFVLAALVREFSQLVPATSSGPNFVLVPCPRTIVWLVNLKWAWLLRFLPARNARNA